MFYRDGRGGVPQHHPKALELLQKSCDCDLGESAAANNLAGYYRRGFPEVGIGMDHYKAKECFEVAAYKNGSVMAWYNLGASYYQMDQDIPVAMYHWRVAAANGLDIALENVKQGRSSGVATKTNLDATLPACKASKDEMRK